MLFKLLLAICIPLKANIKTLILACNSFRSDGFLYAYVSYLDDKLQTCLILLSVDKEHFYEFQQDKKVVVEKLEKFVVFYVKKCISFKSCNHV